MNGTGSKGHELDGHNWQPAEAIGQDDEEEANCKDHVLFVHVNATRSGHGSVSAQHDEHPEIASRE